MTTVDYGGTTYMVNFFLAGVNVQRIRKWSMTNVDMGARTLARNLACAKLKKNNFSCIFPPLFDRIPVTHLRVSDQLINQLIMELLTLDKVSKNTKGVLKSGKCNNMMKFEQFVSSMGLSWEFYTGLLKYRDITGGEHRLIQDKNKLVDLIPNHPKLNDIISLWNNFSLLMDIMKTSSPTSNDIVE